MKPRLSDIERSIQDLKDSKESYEDNYLVFDQDLQLRIVNDELTPGEMEYFQRLENMPAPELKKYCDGVLNEFNRPKKRNRRY